MSLCFIGQAVQTAVTAACITAVPQRPMACSALGAVSHLVTDASSHYLLKEASVVISHGARALFNMPESQANTEVPSDRTLHAHHHDHDHEHHEESFSYSKMALGIVGAGLGSFAANKVFGSGCQHGHAHGHHHAHGKIPTAVNVVSSLVGSYVVESVGSYILESVAQPRLA